MTAICGMLALPEDRLTLNLRIQTAGLRRGAFVGRGKSTKNPARLDAGQGFLSLSIRAAAKILR